MVVDTFNRQTGEFTIRINPQIDFLRGPNSDDGQPQKYVPCSQCGELNLVRLQVVSLFCNEDCAAAWEESNPSQRCEIQGYSHACGYRD